MEKKRVSKKVTATILSMSLLTVMAGAVPAKWGYGIRAQGEKSVDF